MDKIKNVFSSGKTQENEAVHGQGQTAGTHTGHTTGLTGEGSHLSSATTGTGVGNTQHTGFGTATTTAGPHDSNLANKADPTVDSDLSKSRGTTGTAGVVGEGVHHHENERDNFGSTTHGTSTNPSGLSSYHTGTTGTSGPHSLETANRLDPAVNTQGSTLEDAHHHSAEHGGGAESADKHHFGRDTAVGAGGVGLAEHEHRKHETERGTGIGSTGIDHSTAGHYDNTSSTGHHVGRDTGVSAGGIGLAEHEHNKHQQGTAGGLDGPAPNTAGPHKQDWLNKLDPRVNANPETATTGTGPFKADASDYPPGTSKPYDPTTGYIANPAHHGIKSVNPDGSTTRTANPAHHGGSRADHLIGRDATRAGGVGGADYEAEKHHHNMTDSGVAGVAPTTGTTTTTGPHSSNLANKADPSVDSDRSKDHHYGRDAAVAGGVGGAAYEADKHHKHGVTEEKHDHKDRKDSKGGLLSFLHRDKNKKYTQEEEAEFDRQEREHDSHKGRDAALGGAAVGAGAYGAEKHHDQHSTTYDNELNKPLPNAPGNHGVGTGAGHQNDLIGDNTTSGHHLGRDTAAVGGAGAVGEHERNRQGSIPLVEKPVGTDIGDKLHGVERNRGVTGASGFPGSEGFGTGPSHSGVGAHTSDITNTGTGQQHHLGRDTAAGTGGAGLAEHEQRKHEGLTGNQYNNQSGLTGGGTQGTSGLTGSNIRSDHY